MKKYILVLAMLGIMPAAYANGCGGCCNVTEKCTTTCQAKTCKQAPHVCKTNKCGNKRNAGVYYAQPKRSSVYRDYGEVEETRPMVASRRSQMYRDYDEVEERSPVVARKSTARRRSSQERKYFLASPFFQPLKGKFGSVTDVSYANNTFKFDVLNAGAIDKDSTSPTYNNVFPNSPIEDGSNGKAEVSQWLIKEDISYGLTDKVAMVLMAQYDSSKLKLKFNDGSVDDKSSSGLNIFGVGLQGRIVDNEEWIATLSGAFQHQKDTVNSFIFEAKAGRKIDRTTVYGVARLWYSRLMDGDTYGVFIDDSTGDWIMMSYKQDVDNLVYLEGGAGVFSVFDKDIYFGGELVYGYYDWHNQLSLKGMIGVQPNEWFALSLYASTSLYDSAKNKVRNYGNYDVNPELDGDYLIYNPDTDTYTTAISSSSNLVYTTGEYKIKSYNEWKIGIQGTLYF